MPTVEIDAVGDQKVQRAKDDDGIDDAIVVHFTEIFDHAQASLVDLWNVDLCG